MHIPDAPRQDSLYFTYPVFPFTRPVEMDGERPLHDVVIVGGGPVGLVTAIELARHGVRAVVLESKSSVSDGSRALAFSRRSQEIMHGLGITTRVQAKALSWTEGRSFYRDKIIFRLSMPRSAEERFGPMINLQQCYLEKFLVERIADADLAELRWCNQVTGATQTADKVTISLDTPEGAYQLDARYVIAADGARSALRETFGLRMSGASHEGVYLIADIKIDSALPTERHAWFDPPSNPGATMLMHKQPDGLWRVDYQLREDQDPEVELQPERIKARIQSHLDLIGETAPWELEMSSLYKAHCICLDDYRHGRVLFAGDAAHLVPIFGVRGLNSGIADANNLAWKMASVLSGGSADRLLDSYSAERRPATLEIFEQATKSTAFMTPPSRGYRLLRDAALSLALSQPWAGELANPRQSQPYDYADSPLNAETDDDAVFTAGPRTGAPLADARLTDGNHLLDHIGPGPTLLGFGLDKQGPDLDWPGVKWPGVKRLAVSRSAAPAPDTLADPHGHLFERFGATEDCCYLIRPDGHVAGRWRTYDPGVVEAALQRLFAA
ncbi:MAG: FAD-dependent oxidoreductase [Proteobacteria bacterium]|nr:FAD-dependent oxidoreductase [Pseudomonadota bacterium]